MRHRIVIKGNKFVVARTMADAGIPFAFVREAGPNTVGDISTAFVQSVSNLLSKRPELEGRFVSYG